MVPKRRQSERLGRLGINSTLLARACHIYDCVTLLVRGAAQSLELRQVMVCTYGGILPTTTVVQHS